MAFESSRPADFTDDELRSLAAFLARRLTPDLKPTDPTDAPIYGDTPFDRWQRALKQAHAKGRLARVFREAARTLPDDPALAKASALVQANVGADPYRLGASALALATAALVMATFGGVVTTLALSAWSARSSESSASGLRSSAAPQLVAAADPGPSSTSRSADPERTASIGSLGSAQLADEVALGTDVPPVDAAIIAPSVGSAGATAPRMFPDLRISVGPRPAGLRFTGASEVSRAEDGPPGGLAELQDGRASTSTLRFGSCKVDGWFYAGTDLPRDRYVAPHALHVRAEPPTRENGWSSRAPIRCYLGKGDIVRLDERPLELPGHHFWVHLTPDSVSRPLDVVMR